MTRKIRTEIVIETRQLIFLNSLQSAAISFCAECGSEMLKPETAALISVVSAREIFRRVETRDLHFSENPNGLILVCLNSLFKSAK